MASNAKYKFGRKIGRNGAGKGFTLFIFNENMNDVIQITKSLEDSIVLIDGSPETVKYKATKKRKEKEKKREGLFFPALLALLAATTGDFSI